MPTPINGAAVNFGSRRIRVPLHPKLVSNDREGRGGGVQSTRVHSIEHELLLRDRVPSDGGRWHWGDSLS